MHFADNQLITAIRSIIAEEIEVRMKAIDENEFNVWDNRSDIEDIINDYINSNVTVTIEA
jgi:hypothetical protein